MITATRSLQAGELLPARPYAIEGYCPACAGQKKVNSAADMFHATITYERGTGIDQFSDSMLRSNDGRFFKRFSAVDTASYKTIENTWDNKKDSLLYPRSAIPHGEKTKTHLIGHHYLFWHQMFNNRQLLALATLLTAIQKEDDTVLREFLLTAFSASLERNNVFCRFFNDRNTIQGSFDRHDFAPKVTPAENSVWGRPEIRGTFENMFRRMLSGVEYRKNIYDWDIAKSRGKPSVRHSEETIDGTRSLLLNADSRLLPVSNGHIPQIVITDPPYAGNVNYGELSDFFYVWLRLVLKEDYSSFLPEYTPKGEEIIENPTRGKSNSDFREGLKMVFSRVSSILPEDGLCAFTYHHSKDTQWVDLCEAVNEAGFLIEAVYPVHGEKESSLNLQNTEGISYDLLHVCRKRISPQSQQRKSWATVRHEIRRKAKAELESIEAGRYGGVSISAADVRILLIGKCMELYSKHYGRVIDYEDKPVPMRKALAEIRLLVDQLVSKEHALPTELEDIDTPSYIYFTTLCGYKEISADELSKGTRGAFEISVFKDHGLVIKGRQKRGRSFEVKLPVERVNDLKSKFHDNISLQSELFSTEPSATLLPGTIFVDYVHYLIALADLGENVIPWLQKFSGMRPQIRAALEYLRDHPKVSFKDSVKKVLGLMDERTLFTKQG